MKYKFGFTILAVILIGIPGISGAQSVALSDSSLRETLTRAVLFWQAGKAKEAYLSLDTITGQLTSNENASTKVKAALWTANYLQAQKKVKAAAPFLDSAMVWSEKNALGEELIKTYEVYAEWHFLSGNPKTAFVAKEAAFKIRDSLNRKRIDFTIDSLNTVILQLQEEKEALRNDSISAKDTVSDEASSLRQWLYILSAVCVLLLVIVFLMNGTLQRLKHAPPAPAPAAPRLKAEPEKHTSPAAAPVPAATEKPSQKNQASKQSVEQEKDIPAVVPATEVLRPLTPPPLSSKDITLKLQDVELALIRADVLGKYNNGETKAIRNLLNEYMAQLPFIMKTLDDAITKNDSEPILLSLEHLKPYLNAFGMQNTMKLIFEIEEEAKTEKVSKLLSRVFQIRNHCRRAADESKALLEKIS